MELGRHYLSMGTIIGTQAVNRIKKRQDEGFGAVIVCGMTVLEFDKDGYLKRKYNSKDEADRGKMVNQFQKEVGYVTRTVTSIQNTNGNSRAQEFHQTEHEFAMYAHVIERVRDRFPHTKNWGLPALVRFTIKMFCSSKDEFVTTYGERYVIKGKMVFVVNLKNVIVTVITVRKEHKLYAECYAQTREKIPGWLASKNAVKVSEDLIISYSRKDESPEVN